jgi:hypothetical protein
MSLLRVHGSSSIGCLGYTCRVVKSKLSASSHVAAFSLTVDGAKSVLKGTQMNFRCSMLASTHLPTSRSLLHRTQAEDEITI